MDRLIKNRESAGIDLAKLLQNYTKNTLVLGIPRGGVPVAYQIAKILNLPLDVFLVRKLGSPYNKEYALGAIASNNECYLNEEAVASLGSNADQIIQDVIAEEKKELHRREMLYHKNKSINYKNKTIILVDDGIATGATIKVAIELLKQMGAVDIVVAVPVLPHETVDEFTNLGIKVVYLIAPKSFFGVGNWYKVFNQVEDEEVIKLLRGV